MIRTHRTEKTAFATGGLLGWAIMLHLSATVFQAQVAQAQVVQLPTFHFFTVQTSVLVPDGGDAMLGGISHSATGRVERGIPGLPGRPFTNVATGSSVGASVASMHAEIQDLAAMDKALLGDDPLAVANQGSPNDRQSIADSQPLKPAEKLASVAAIKAQIAADDATHDRAAAAALSHARELLADHKPAVAKIYLQSAIRQSGPTSDIHQQAVAALAALQQANAANRIAGQ